MRNKEYWEQESVESMYDKHLLNVEINLILDWLTPNSKILDAGCGEGEGSAKYALVPDVTVHCADFAQTRLEKARERLGHLSNVSLFNVDFLQENLPLDNDYDFIISQRFLINLATWDEQKLVLWKFMKMLNPSGMLLLLEGSGTGVCQLNNLRALFGLKPIPVKWHNLFIDDDELINFMKDNGFHFISLGGLGTYYFLTRGIRPALDNDLRWDCDYNKVCASKSMCDFVGFRDEFSRLKLFVFGKDNGEWSA